MFIKHIFRVIQLKALSLVVYRCKEAFKMHFKKCDVQAYSCISPVLLHNFQELHNFTYMSNTITQTNFSFPKQTSFYKGKVRDVYTIDNQFLVIIATDRLSAFDVVLPKGIPYKGQVLNQMATSFLEATQDIVPNWLIKSVDPNVAIGHICTPFKIEMVVRGYLSGHAAREYQQGKRVLCGVSLPQGLKENDKLDQPIITPSTKEAIGMHDQDISKEQIIAQGLVSAQDYQVLEKYALALFAKGTQIAQERGLILVDTKYEFGKDAQGNIMLIDEIHTPDSSRYFYSDQYHHNQMQGLPQKQLSKEFVRQWLIEQGFTGQPHQVIPQMSSNYINSISGRYIELYNRILAREFVKADLDNINQRIEKNVLEFLQQNLK